MIIRVDNRNNNLSGDGCIVWLSNQTTVWWSGRGIISIQSVKCIKNPTDVIVPVGASQLQKPIISEESQLSSASRPQIAFFLSQICISQHLFKNIVITYFEEVCMFKMETVMA